MKFLYMLQHKCILKACQVKENSHKRPHIRWFHLCEMSRKDKSVETESRSVATRKGRCWEKVSVTANKFGVSFRDHENLILIMVLVAQDSEYLKIIKLYTLSVWILSLYACHILFKKGMSEPVSQRATCTSSYWSAAGRDYRLKKNVCYGGEECFKSPTDRLYQIYKDN